MAIGLDTAFGSYRVEAALGEGGQAAVWRVRHQTLDSLAALKVLRVATESLERRLIQEGRVQASLRHPNIVSVLDVVHLDGAVGLLLEYVDGESLEEWMHLPRSYSEGETLFMGILAAMETAHGRGIVHRDLKPANVLLAHVGGLLLPKVADFGLARLLDEGGAGTRTGMAMGTLCYMAPEQVRDARTADVRADIFSLGCMLYALCTGRTPFPAPDLFAYYRAIERRDFVAASTLVPGLPARFDEAIGGCLAFDRGERIPDVATLRQVLIGSRPWQSKPAAGTAAGGAGGDSGGGTFDSNNVSFAELADGVAPTAVPVSIQAEVSGSQQTHFAAFPGSASEPAAATLRSRWTVPGLAAGLLLLAIAAFASKGWFGRAVSPEAPAGASAAVAPLAVAPLPVAAPEAAPLPVASPEAAVAPTSGASHGSPAPPASIPRAAAPAAASPVSRAVAAPPAAAVSGPPPTIAAPVALDVAPESAQAPPNPRVGVSASFSADPSYDVLLEGAGGAFSPGQIPAGDYAITADFGAGRKTAGSVTVNAGQVVAVRCSTGGGRCVAR